MHAARIWAPAATPKSPTPTTFWPTSTKCPRGPRACCLRPRPRSSCDQWKPRTCSTSLAAAARPFWAACGAIGAALPTPWPSSWATNLPRRTTSTFGSGFALPCPAHRQFYDSIRWLADQLVQDLPGERIAIYAGSGKSAIWQDGSFTPAQREDIKEQVRLGQIRLLLGTVAASEGLNLQRISTLINLDLPWDPTRLEQRKGRIQRSGLSDVVLVYNMRYLDSVEDRVHQLLSWRLQEIFALFGQVPDVLQDVWIDVALGEVERAKQVIAAVPKKPPFDIKYQRIERIDWKICERVLPPPPSAPL